MKQKIFNLKTLMLGVFLALTQLAYAQTASGNEAGKEFNKQMRELQQQMRELQTRMNKLQSEEFKKKSAELQKMAKELQGKAQLYAEGIQSSGIIKDFNLNMKNMQPLAFLPYAPAGPGMSVPHPPSAPNSTTINGYSFQYSDNDLKKQIESGEVIEKVKNYSKSYNVDGNDKLQISNKYGRVTVNTWAKNEVKVDVQIKADANEENDAQKLLDGVSITDSKENSVVSFTTNISTNNSSNTNFMGTFFSSGKNRVRKIEVNYTVYMPAKSQLQITNRYGATILPNLTGKVVVNNAYGSLTAKSLSNAGNEVTVKYGSANIENFSGSELNVAYGSLVLGEADKLNANVSYSSAKIGSISTSGSINVKYSGGLQIADLDKNLKSLLVNSSYSTVKVGVNENQNADFDVTVRYGSFNHDNRNVNVINTKSADSDRSWSPTKTYKGSVGKANTGKLITINSNYGSVKFDQ